MDPNLTTPIILNATLNGTLNQPSQSLFSNPSLLAILGVVVGWLLNYFTSVSQEKNKSKTEALQKKKQLYSKFKGITLLVSQLCNNQSNLLTSYFHTIYNREMELNVYDIQRDYEKLFYASESKVVRTFKELCELIGSIQVSFSPNSSLDNDIGELYRSIWEYNSVYTEIQYGFKTRTGRWSNLNWSNSNEIIEKSDNEIKEVVVIIVNLMETIGVSLMEEINLTEKTSL